MYLRSCCFGARCTQSASAARAIEITERSIFCWPALHSHHTDRARQLCSCVWYPGFHSQAQFWLAVSRGTGCSVDFAVFALAAAGRRLRVRVLPACWLGQCESGVATGRAHAGRSRFLLSVAMECSSCEACNASCVPSSPAVACLRSQVDHDIAAAPVSAQHEMQLEQDAVSVTPLVPCCCSCTGLRSWCCRS